MFGKDETFQFLRGTPLNGTNHQKDIFSHLSLSTVYIAGCLLDTEMPKGVQRTVVAAGPRIPGPRAVTVERAPGLGALASVLAEVRQTSGRHGRESEKYQQSLDYWTIAMLVVQSKKPNKS